MRNENYPGLAMSRSIGDMIASSVGVICDPGKIQFNFKILFIFLEILEYEVRDYTRYIVIASDGIWEFLDNNRVMTVVNSFYNKNDPEGACNALIKEATQWWEKVRGVKILIII